MSFVAVDIVCTVSTVCLFVTDAVTAEEDDLWSSLPVEALANQHPVFQSLQHQLSDVNQQIRQLSDVNRQIHPLSDVSQQLQPLQPVVSSVCKNS